MSVDVKYMVEASHLIASKDVPMLMQIRDKHDLKTLYKFLFPEGWQIGSDGRPIFPYSSTPLHRAIQRDVFYIFPYLVEIADSINKQDMDGDTALMKAVKNPQCTPAIIRILLQRGADIAITEQDDGTTAFISAVMLGRGELISEFVKAIRIRAELQFFKETGRRSANRNNLDDVRRIVYKLAGKWNDKLYSSPAENLNNPLLPVINLQTAIRSALVNAYVLAALPDDLPNSMNELLHLVVSLPRMLLERVPLRQTPTHGPAIVADRVVKQILEVAVIGPLVIGERFSKEFEETIAREASKKALMNSMTLTFQYPGNKLQPVVTNPKQVEAQTKELLEKLKNAGGYKQPEGSSRNPCWADHYALKVLKPFVQKELTTSVELHEHFRKEVIFTTMIEFALDDAINKWYGKVQAKSKATYKF